MEQHDYLLRQINKWNEALRNLLLLLSNQSLGSTTTDHLESISNILKNNLDIDIDELFEMNLDEYLKTIITKTRHNKETNLLLLDVMIVYHKLLINTSKQNEVSNKIVSYFNFLVVEKVPVSIAQINTINNYKNS
jgi:hypothetical protein